MDCKPQSEEEPKVQIEQYQKHPTHELQMMEPPTPSEMRKKRKRTHINGDSVHGLESQTSDRPQSPSVSSPHHHATKIPIPHTSSDSNYVHTRQRTDVSGSAEERPPLSTSPQPPPVSPSPLARPHRVSRTYATSSTSSSAPPGAVPQPNVGNTMTTITTTTSDSNTQAKPPQQKLPQPLEGVTVHIIHVKDTLADGPRPGDVIGVELKNHAEEVGLGCNFDVTSCGESIWV